MNAKEVESFVLAATEVFQVMLACPIERRQISLKCSAAPTFPVSGVLVLSGRSNGMLVLSLSQQVALKMVETLLGAPTLELNADVEDAVGEMANMILGVAKRSLPERKLTSSLPRAVIDVTSQASLVTDVPMQCVLFDTPWGPMALEFGLTPLPATIDVNYVNPFIRAAAHVFHTVLDCEIERRKVVLKDHHAPSYMVSAMIGLSGNARGIVMLSMVPQLAFHIVETLMETQVHEINADVKDAVGELANMIAGVAKASLDGYKLSISLPSVVIGRNHAIDFPAVMRPLCVLFDTPRGPMALEVGLEPIEAMAA